jgi:hypothetical protein
MLRLLERIKVTICSFSLLSHRFCALSVCCLSLVLFYFILFESSWSIVLTKSVLDRLTWSDLSICDMDFCLVV